MFQNIRTGWILLLSHLTAVWLTGILYGLLRRKKHRPETEIPPFRTNPALLYDSLCQSVISILCVGGFIALFTCLGQMLEDLGLIAPAEHLFGAYAPGLVRGLLEMTTGCSALAKIGTPLSAALSAGLVTFGGLCVLCQQATYLTRAGVKLLPFVGMKLLQAVLASVICFLLI